MRRRDISFNNVVQSCAVNNRKFKCRRVAYVGDRPNFAVKIRDYTDISETGNVYECCLSRTNIAAKMISVIFVGDLDYYFAPVYARYNPYQSPFAVGSRRTRIAIAGDAERITAKSTDRNIYLNSIPYRFRDSRHLAKKKKNHTFYIYRLSTANIRIAKEN